MRKLSGYGPSLIVLGTAMLVLFLGPSAVQHLTYKQNQARMIQASQRLDENNILEQINQAYQDIAVLVEPSVVHISAQSAGGYDPLSAGSGWLYDDNGHIVTNYHVVKDAGRIEIQLSTGELRPAEVVGYDDTTDIAVLKIPSGRLHPAKLGDTDSPVRQGDIVFAFGSPFDFRFSMSSGVVSGKGRSVGVIRSEVGRPIGYENFIQVDAAINPGNSGGPLTDFRGRVIGMNSAIATGGKGSSLEEGQFAGIGLAIPLEMIVPVVTQIIEKGHVEKGLLGVVPFELDVSAAQQLGFIGTGVLIVNVEPGFPADIAGVRVSDIVTAVNGESVSNPNQLRSVVSSMLPGQTAVLTIWRPDMESGTGKELTVPVKLERKDPLRDDGTVPADQSRESIPQIGIAKMSTATASSVRDHGAQFRRGVLIEELVPDSQLAMSTVPGSIITIVEDYEIADVEEFINVLRKYDLRGRGVRAAIILPNGSRQIVVLRVR